MKPIRTYAVHVDGYTSALYSARSPGKARARAWRDFCSVYQKTFKEFLAISYVLRVADPPGIGERILVAGLPATRVIGRSDQYVWFMRDDSDVVLCSHPADVSRAPHDRAHQLTGG